MTELERAQGGKDIVDVLSLSRHAYTWLSHEYNQQALQRIENAKRFLKKIFMNEAVDISARIDDLDESPFLSDHIAWVAARGKEMYISDTMQLSQIKDYCDSFSIYAYEDGTVGIVLYIHDTIRKIERG